MIAIPNMEKPKSCWHCPFVEAIYKWEAMECGVYCFGELKDKDPEQSEWQSKTYDDCPLIEIDQEDEEAVLFLLRMRKAMREGKNWREFLDEERRADEIDDRLLADS